MYLYIETVSFLKTMFKRQKREKMELKNKLMFFDEIF